MNITAFDIAKRFVGIKEVPGSKDHPFIVWCLSLCGLPQELLHDETAWCSAFVNGICFILGIAGSGKANARSWLAMGTPITIEEARPGMDIVIYKRGVAQPGPEVLDAPGHVHFFGSLDSGMVYGVGGNQSNSVTIQGYKRENILGVRRLA